MARRIVTQREQYEILSPWRTAGMTQDQWREIGGVPTRPSTPYGDKSIAGTLKQHKYPDEVDFPLYHGTSAQLNPGDLVIPNQPGNFAKRMKHVYSADAPEKVYQYGGGNVYEVRSTGPIGHRSDARPEQGYYASAWPYEVVRSVHPDEYADQLKAFRAGR